MNCSHPLSCTSAYPAKSSSSSTRVQAAKPTVSSVGNFIAPSPLLLLGRRRLVWNDISKSWAFHQARSVGLISALDQKILPHFIKAGSFESVPRQMGV